MVGPSSAPPRRLEPIMRASSFSTRSSDGSRSGRSPPVQQRQRGQDEGAGVDQPRLGIHVGAHQPITLRLANVLRREAQPGVDVGDARVPGTAQQLLHQEPGVGRFRAEVLEDLRQRLLERRLLAGQRRQEPGQHRPPGARPSRRAPPVAGPPWTRSDTAAPACWFRPRRRSPAPTSPRTHAGRTTGPRRRGPGSGSVRSLSVLVATCS